MRPRETRAFLGVWMVLALCCAAPGENNDSPPAVRFAKSSPAATQPAAPDAQQRKAILADLDAYARKGMKDWKVPGMAVAIVQGDEIVYAQAFGLKQVGTSDPVNTHTVFQIGSTTKAFSAALVAMQVDAGKVKWDDRVIDHLPDFRMQDPWVTREFRVVDLMAQRSGMPAYAGDAQALLGFPREHIIHSIRLIKPVSSFRSQFAYVNNLWLVAGQLAAKYEEKPWEQCVIDRIFKPLGMSESSVDAESFRKAKNVTTTHVLRDGKVVAIPNDSPTIDWSYVYGPAGAINSNVLDMTRWLRLQMHDGAFEGKQLISPGSLRFMHSPKTATSALDPMQYYCQGWIYRENCPYPILWHNGGTLGCKTMVAFVPEAKIGIVVLSNLISELPESLAYRFFDRFFGNEPKDYSAEALKKRAEQQKKAKGQAPKPPASPAPPLPLEDYAGQYANEMYGTLPVAPQGDGLLVTLGPRKVELTLKPFHRDTFEIQPSLFDDAPHWAEFRIGPDGKATELTLGNFNDDGCGVFTRAAKTPTP